MELLNTEFVAYFKMESQKKLHKNVRRPDSIFI